MKLLSKDRTTYRRWANKLYYLGDIYCTTYIRLDATDNKSGSQFSTSGVGYGHSYIIYLFEMCDE